ncbi:hypothetical protein OSSY52_19790 [Tepiditoga spiralis]|uniref:Uncharacterized protein n=1 Tax=Tepiditoga spiralis TaxID=2108365 RepID=A0A7G1G5I6_9BACT|nr:hypothetical protein [Tepiditoga spiralis]BBE31838.1 hypothetical protein OSSY52_19790 [Tepiditoga spiralis]
MKKEIDALIYAKRYYSAIIGYEEDPYYTEDAAYFRKMAIIKLRKLKDPKNKKEIKLILKNTDNILRREKKKLIDRLSRISSMDRKELKYLERI